MIKILEQDSLSEKGRRANNEDNGGWDSGKVYVVCDGVGGNEKGEVASEIVVNTFIEEFKNNSEQSVNQVLTKAESKMLNYLQQNPQSSGMATTMTLLRIRENGVFASWVGDSRIYQFRKGKILFQSRDHSWVNDAVDAGIITHEESINHPKSNIITRAIQGAQKPTQADEVQLTDIDAGDYFFMCSDGVLETWDDMELSALFAQDIQIQEITQKIKEECSKISRDNYTAILFKIEKGLPSEIRKPEPIYLTRKTQNHSQQKASTKQLHQEPHHSNITNTPNKPLVRVVDSKNDEDKNDENIRISINKKSLYLIGIIVVLLGIIGVLLWYLFSNTIEVLPEKKPNVKIPIIESKEKKVKDQYKTRPRTEKKTLNSNETIKSNSNNPENDSHKKSDKRGAEKKTSEKLPEQKPQVPGKET
jgi:serine/threonine protein phosphatase PrpC